MMDGVVIISGCIYHIHSLKDGSHEHEWDGNAWLVVAVHWWFWGETEAEYMDVKHKECEIALYESNWLIPYDSIAFDENYVPVTYITSNHL